MRINTKTSIHQHLNITVINAVVYSGDGRGDMDLTNDSKAHELQDILHSAAHVLEVRQTKLDEVCPLKRRSCPR
jgi:hypothetical protein